MTPIERMAICQYCKNRTMDREVGTVCGLTMKKPTFTDECPDYNQDDTVLKRDQERQMERAENPTGNGKISTWSIVVGVLIVLRFIWRFSQN